MSLQLGNFISAALAIGISPWMLLPQFMIHIGSYFRSRSTENALGKGAHDLYVLEANASISSALISDFFRRKGFKVGKIDSIDNTVKSFNTNYRYAYQPLSWGIMDKIREDSSSDNRENRPVRSPAMQRVGI